ncbi:MAG: hypothetical protein F4Z76_04225 [Rhodothermaceae bacterium]|nr:hypothetical protein [Rhodothermaceae bacterium]
MLFAEEEKPIKRTRVVEPVKPSESAKRKAQTKRTQDGEKARSFAGLMEELSKLSRLTVIPKMSTNTTAEIVMIKDVSATQKQAFKLLNLKPL